MLYMTAPINEKLVQFLNEGKPWEKKATSIPGVFLFKLPTFKGTSPSLAIEVNPVSSSTGAVTKKRGVIIRSAPELEEITQLLSNPKVAQLAKNIDEVNPQKDSTTGKSSSEVFEI
jgi:hypothetical protein